MGVLLLFVCLVAGTPRESWALWVLWFWCISHFSGLSARPYQVGFSATVQTFFARHQRLLFYELGQCEHLTVMSFCFLSCSGLCLSHFPESVPLNSVSAATRTAHVLSFLHVCPSVKHIVVVVTLSASSLCLDGFKKIPSAFVSFVWKCELGIVRHVALAFCSCDGKISFIADCGNEFAWTWHSFELLTFAFPFWVSNG